MKDKIELTQNQIDGLMNRFYIIRGEKIIYHLELSEPEIEILSNNGMTRTFIKINQL